MVTSVNSALNVAKVQLNKAVPQPKQTGLGKDTFQKSSAVTNPVVSYKPTPAVYENALGINKPRKPRRPEFTIEQMPIISSLKENMRSTYGNEIEKLTFEKDIYTPESMYVLKAELRDGGSATEFYDREFKKVGEEKQRLYSHNGVTYLITKSNDYRNNTTSKVRMELDKDYYPIVTDEVKIVRDKNNNIIRKELMTHSVIDGAYDQKYVYPDGTEKIISQTKKFKKMDDMEVIVKNMESLDGTKTNYRIEQDKKGNRLLEYKITDKDGKVLMNLNKTLERVNDNKVISSNGDKVHEISFEPGKVVIQERGKDKKTVINTEIKLRGDKDAMINLMKKMPGEQLMALNDTVKVLKGVKDTNDCCMLPQRKQIDTIDDLFSVLHEGGHAIDFRRSNTYSEYADLTHDKEVQKVYLEEKDAYNKAFPNAQRDHIGYFIQIKGHYAGKWGGLGEVIAEVNALRDSYTTEGILAPRVQYLQQYFPKTVACLNNKLENYNQRDAK